MRRLVAALGLLAIASSGSARVDAAGSGWAEEAGDLETVPVEALGAAEELVVDPDVPVAIDAKPQGTVLVGIAGAATALASRDAERALALSSSLEPAPPPGSETWFTVGAIQGRAHRLMGRPDQAVAALAPLWGHKKLAKYFPPDVLGLELARAHLETAEAGAADADAARKHAIAVLGKVEKLEPIRNLAHVRVTRAIAQAQSDDRASAARGAIALDKMRREYPNHPDAGSLWLLHAQALARAGKTADAAAQLRTIAVHRTGEPEATAAWSELDQLAREHPKRVSARAFTPGEQLERASAARRLRRVDASRSILDEMLADPSTPAHLRDDAIRSRAFTATKQRDFVRCSDDLRPIYAKTGNVDVRDDLLKCLEKAGLYEEALAIELEDAKSKKKMTRMHARWQGIELAVRGGLYEKAAELLAAYEKDGKGHGAERAWLHAWLPYRLGKTEDAIAGFRKIATRRGEDGRRARYFLGKLLFASDDAAKKKEGEGLLRGVVAAGALDYYGLLARSRLREAGKEGGPVPKLVAPREETKPPTRADAQDMLDSLVAEYGEAWPPVTRTRQLYAAGYNEEARRELRVAVTAFLTRGKKAGGPRNEDVIAGLGWKADWKFPRVAPTKLGRKSLRTAAAVEELRTGLRTVAHVLDEPHSYVKLTTAKEASARVRWFPRAFRAAVEREARLRDVDPKHMWALMYTESRFRRHVVSPVGARGALQIMPWTAHQLADRLGELEDDHFDVDTLFDIDRNAHLSAYYVDELLHKFHGQAPLVYASYNGGPWNVARWLAAKSKSPAPLELDAFVEEIALSESYRYTKRVTEIYSTYALMYEGELPVLPNAIDPEFEDNIDF